MTTRRALSGVAGRIRPAVFAELQSRMDALAARGEELIPLHIGDTHLAPPNAALRVLADLEPTDTSLHRYGATAGLGALREAIGRVLTSRGAVYDPATEILVGNGGTHALYCAARAVLDAGDEVILASPYWPLAPGVFTACGAVPVEAPLTQRLYEDPSLDPAVILAEALSPRTKALYFISPNNPDGKVLTEAQLERVAAFALEHDLWIFADEVYADIVYAESVYAESVDAESVDAESVDAAASSPGPIRSGAGVGVTAPSIVGLEGMRERTIALHSLSKSHALAGLRVGFVSGPQRVIEAARRVSTHTAFNVSVAMQRAGAAALADAAFPSAARDIYRAARASAITALAGAPIRFHAPEGATYLFLDFAPALTAREAGTPPSIVEERPLYRILEGAVDRGVLLAPGAAFGRHYESFARLCFTSVPTARVVLGIARLRDAVDAFVRGDS